MSDTVPGNAKLMGVIMIILGWMAIATPLLTGKSVLLLLGMMVMAGGILRMIWAFQASSLGKGILKFLLGILTLIAGSMILSNPLLASGVLAIMLAVYLFVDGLTEIMAAISLPSGQGKVWLLLDGVISIVLGGLIYAQFPLSGALAIGIFLGVKLLFAGMVMLTLGTTVQTAAE